MCAFFNSLWLREKSKILPQLLEEDERNDGVGSQSDEGGNIALVKGQWTLLGRERNQVHGPTKLSRLGVHCTRL